MQGLRKIGGGLVVAACMAALPATAHASVLVEYSIDGGGTWTQICTSGTNGCSGTVSIVNGPGAITITTASVATNSPGTGASSDLFSTTTFLQNTGAAFSGLRLRFGGDGFSQPTQGTLVNNLSGTSTLANGTTATQISCAVAGGTVGAGNSVDCPAGVVTGAASTGIPNVGTFGVTTTTPVTTIGTPYELAELLTVNVGAGTVNAPTSVNFANSTSLVAAPEPTSLALMATGLVGLVGVVRRRRTGDA